MSLASNVTNLAQAVGNAVKDTNNRIGTLTELDTSTQTSIVAAINEVNGSLATAAGIDDGNTSGTTTWSSQKLSTELGGKAALTHGHAQSDITGLDTSLAGKAAASHTHVIGDLPVATSGTSSNSSLVRADDSRLSNARTPTAHNHAIGDVTGLQAVLDGKAAGSHEHTSEDISDFTAAVDARVQNVVGAAPAALDTLAELAAALGGDANFAASVNTALGKRVAVDSIQSFTGGEAAQGRSNIGAASAAGVGDTETNFADVFTAALA